MAHQYCGKKILITTQSWFYAPDGNRYSAVYGTLHGIFEAGKTLGFIPNRSHANWYVEIGTMTIMGCQCLYFTLAESINEGEASDWNLVGEKYLEYKRPSAIYVMD